MALWETSAKTFRGRGNFRFWICIFFKKWRRLAGSFLDSPPGPEMGRGAGPFLGPFGLPLKAGGVGGPRSGPEHRDQIRIRRYMPIWPPFREKIKKKNEKKMFFCEKMDAFCCPTPGWNFPQSSTFGGRAVQGTPQKFDFFGKFYPEVWNIIFLDASWPLQ